MLPAIARNNCDLYIALNTQRKLKIRKMADMYMQMPQTGLDDNLCYEEDGIRSELPHRCKLRKSKRKDHFEYHERLS